MREKFGVILIDHSEVVIHIYEKDEKEEWRLVKRFGFDLATFQSEKRVEANEIIQIIAQVSLSHDAFQVHDWTICARGIREETIQEIHMATSIETEALTLAREQDLLCKGMLMEIK